MVDCVLDGCGDIDTLQLAVLQIAFDSVLPVQVFTNGGFTLGHGAAGVAFHAYRDVRRRIGSGAESEPHRLVVHPAGTIAPGAWLVDGSRAVIVVKAGVGIAEGHVSSQQTQVNGIAGLVVQSTWKPKTQESKRNGSG